MNPVSAGLLAVAILSPAVACSTSPKPPPPRLVSAGERIAAANCGQCHALTAEQESPLDGAPPFPALRERYDRAAMAQVLDERMVVLHPRMPKLRLDPDQLAEFLDYWAAITPSPPS